MDSDLFTLAAQELEARTDLDQLEARGTLRIALKKAGVDSKSVTVAELQVVLERIMPDELKRCGTPNAAAVCDELVKSLPSDVPDAEGGALAARDEVMRRLGNG
jgi:hypothetical protein